MNEFRKVRAQIRVLVDGIATGLLSTTIPLIPGRATPAFECIGCRPHGIVYLRRPGELKRPQNPALIDGTALEAFSVREDIASSDEQRVFASSI
jgi:hypothetical protein